MGNKLKLPILLILALKQYLMTNRYKLGKLIVENAELENIAEMEVVFGKQSLIINK